MSVLVAMLVAVLAAIALMWNLSRRPSRPTSPAAYVDVPTAPPAPEAAVAATAGAAEADEAAMSARQQSEIARVIKDGRAGLKVCYQRALVRDESLVHGDLTVRLAVAPSGRVDHVSVIGAPAFRALEPCLQTAVSKWRFPTASEPYQAEFPLVLQGRQ